MCFCDACGPTGALQARATISVHGKAQQARARFSSVPGDGSTPPAPEPLTVDAFESTTTPVAIAGSDHPTEQTQGPLCTMRRLERRLTSFTRPSCLIFRTPPRTPTEMYPGPGTDDVWLDGAAALRVEAGTNAVVLLHVHFLETMLNNVRVNEGYEDIADRIRRELAALENWRMSEWTRQQRETPDPHGLGRRMFITGERDELYHWLPD